MLIFDRERANSWLNYANFVLLPAVPVVNDVSVFDSESVNRKERQTLGKIERHLAVARWTTAGIC